jgi:SAM-dependent methyltransferase
MNIEVVKNYYGKVLKSSEDLKTSACCDGGGVPLHLEPLLSNVHEEVRAKYYGCGIVVPAALEAARVLDLGSGSGRDVYMMAQLVGPKGEVVGVDMTGTSSSPQRKPISTGTCGASATRGRMCASSRAISRSSESLGSSPRVST